MRIGLFTDTYVPIHNGISYVVELARAGLEELGHEVYIFAPSPDFRYEETDPHIIRFKALKGVTYDDDLTSVFFPPTQLQKINKLDLDIIQFFTPNQVGLLGLMAGLRYDIPVISQYSTDLYQYVEYYPAAQKVILAFPIAAPVILRKRLKSWGKAIGSLPKDRTLAQWKKRLTAEYATSMHDQCDAVVVLSKKHLKQLAGWGTKSNMYLIPTGVNPLPQATAEELAAFRAHYGVLPTEKLILNAGRLSKEKNLDLLLTAFLDHIAPHNKDIKLMFGGDFDYRVVLEDRAKESEYSDRVIFTGSYVRDQAGVIYGAADLFAFPSLTDTQGIVLHEAAGAGLPFALCDGEVSEIFHDGENGLLAENDPKDYAQKMLTILEDPKLQKAMSAKSIEFAAEFTEAKQIKELENLFVRCIANHKPVRFAGGDW
jgi:glycosyltransferase involved in cell wall biosynthesis